MPADRPDHRPATDHTAAILAVKSLADAKSRLTGWDDHNRRALVTAMLADTIAAIRAAGCPHVWVVSPDPVVLREAADSGATGIAETLTALRDDASHSVSSIRARVQHTIDEVGQAVGDFGRGLRTP